MSTCFVKALLNNHIIFFQFFFLKLKFNFLKILVFLKLIFFLKIQKSLQLAHLWSQMDGTRKQLYWKQLKALLSFLLTSQVSQKIICCKNQRGRTAVKDVFRHPYKKTTAIAAKRTLVILKKSKTQLVVLMEIFKTYLFSHNSS